MREMGGGMGRQLVDGVGSGEGSGDGVGAAGAGVGTGLGVKAWLPPPHEAIARAVARTSRSNGIELSHRH